MCFQFFTTVPPLSSPEMTDITLAELVISRSSNANSLLHFLSLGHLVFNPPTFTFTITITITAPSTATHHLCLRRNAHLRPPHELDLSKDVRIQSDHQITEDDDDDKEKKKKREACQSVSWAMDGFAGEWLLRSAEIRIRCSRREKKAVQLYRDIASRS